MATSLLKISNSQVLFKFLHDCIDDLIGRKHITFDSCTDEIEWKNDDFLAALNFIKSLYKENAIHSSEDDLDYHKIQDLSSSFQQCIKECYQIRRKQIRQAVTQEKLLIGSRPIIENVDWKLKWIIGTSKLASLRKPLVQMDLYCFKKEEEQNRKTINFEMNLEQVNALINELENVKRQYN